MVGRKGRSGQSPNTIPGESPPEVGAAPTAEEMEGKETIERDITPDVPAEDVGDWVRQINLCSTIDELQMIFTKAYKQLKLKESIKAITDVKDDKKKELMLAEIKSDYQAKSSNLEVQS